MCRKVKPVVNSHLFPESLYSHVRQGAKSPILVGEGMVRPTDRHWKAYLLCLECEDILNKKGETWVCPRLGWPEARFPLFDMFEKAGGWCEAGQFEAIYYGANNPEIQVEKIMHFALGMFWRASVHSWVGREKPTMIDLGRFGEPIRAWLHGTAPFPPMTFVDVILARPQKLQLNLIQPAFVPTGKPWKTYKFYALGAMFTLTVGDFVPMEDRLICFRFNPQHPVLVSDRLGDQLSYKLASEFFEARKTKAYLRSLAKQRKK
jgi:hypothetical protein